MKAEVDPTRISITWQEPALMQIGKGGVSDNVVEEARRLLKKHEYMKVRILRTALGESTKREIMNQLCQKTGARLDGFRGNTAVIYKTRQMLAIS